MTEKKYIIPHQHEIQKQDRQKLRGHRSQLIWFTGLSGSGKSTLANLLEQNLHQKGYATYILDGDNIRSGLNQDLGFKAEDRQENIRRIGEVAKLMVEAGVVVITAFISPFQADRDKIRARFETEEFVEVFVECPLEVCEERDVKGLYKKARAGEIKNFTGIDSPFEVPPQPEVHIHSDTESTEESIKKILDFIEAKLKLDL